MDKQQAPTVAHGNLLNVMGSLDQMGLWERMDARVSMAESLCCPPETVTTLLTS